MVVFRKEGETLEQALKRTMEEKTKLDLEYHEPKAMGDKVRWFDYAILIIETSNIDLIECKKIYIPEDEQCLTFRDILKKFGIKLLTNFNVYTLILNRGLDGEIWQYGNYKDCDKWMYYGETRGYA